MHSQKPFSLIVEDPTYEVKYLIDEQNLNEPSNYFIQGPYLMAEQSNRNKRIYKLEEMVNEVNRYSSEMIKTGRALGELDHPESSVINLKNVSHNIVKLWWEGKDLYGDIEILPTPSGNILKQLFQNNITVGISSRAMGSTTPIGEGLVQVEDDLDLICWDFVSTPSTYGAFMKPVGLTEGVINENYKTKKHNKYDTANSLLYDIVCTQTGICCLR